MAKTGATDNCTASVDVSTQRETTEHLAFTELTWGGGGVQKFSKDIIAPQNSIRTGYPQI